MFFVSFESQTIIIKAFLMSTRELVVREIYHNNGPQIALLIIAKSLYTDCNIIEKVKDHFEVNFPSIDV